MEIPYNMQASRHRPLVVVLFFAALFMLVSAGAVFFFDFYCGQATRGFGVPVGGGVGGVGMFYLYMMGFYTALLVILPMLIIRRFGVALAIYLPYVGIGFPINYYYEWSEERLWRSPFGGLGWTVAFLTVALSADVAFRLFRGWHPRWRSIGTGVVLSLVTFLVTPPALKWIYVAPPPSGPGSFLGVAYFCLPWLLLQGAFGGDAAYAIFRDRYAPGLGQ